jgi:cyclophilin family peptidyl-prolyl cis-trans isomerase
MFYLGNFYFDAGRLDEAKAIFETIVTQFPDHPLVKLALADNKSLVRQAIEDCAAELSWQTRYPRQEIRKPVLDEKVTATMHLSTGDVKLRFYANVAPAHVANFLKRAEAGEYDGTKVGMVMLDSTVTFGEKVVPQAGRDPREGGTDPTQTQPHEYSMLSHARGTLSMSRGGAGSSLQLFQVVIKDQSNFDFTQTIFGRVVEGIEVVDAIARGPKDQFQRPSPEVLIKNVTIRREP